MKQLVTAIVVIAFGLTGCRAGTSPNRESGGLVQQWAKDGIVPITAENPDGSQSLAVFARGGYFPVTENGKAGVPSVLRIYTNKTYDCSRAFLIPALKVRKTLPAEGVTEILIPAQAKGSTLFGTCSMGMYSFTIVFN
jgi:uncharacterized protein